jgi:hypothetical protein
MASTINAITTGAGGIVTTGDSSGNISLQSSGSTVLAATSSGVNVTGTFNVNGAPISVAGGASTVSQGTSLTLTSSSNRVQNVTLTAASLAVILPDATTLSAGGPTFTINNTGNYSFYVNANNGVGIFWLAPYQTLVLSLSDNSTAQGQWNTQYGRKTYGQYPYSSVDGTNALSTTIYNYADLQSLIIQQLTSTTMFLAWARGTSIYGVVATNTSGTLSYGTVTLIYNGSTTAATNFTGKMLSSTAGLVMVDVSTGSIAVPITISGTAITVGTSAAVFGSPQSGLVITGIAVMSSTIALVTHYNSSSVLLAKTITHNGASAPTLGTASVNITISNATINCPVVPLTATTAQIWYPTTSTTTISTRIVTISGSSAPTLGTAITQTGNINNGSGYFAATAAAYSATETFINLNGQFISYSISGTTVTQQNSKLNLINDVAFRLINIQSNVQICSFTQISSGIYLSIDTVFNNVAASAGFISKYNYITGDNLYPIGSNEISYLSTYYPAGITLCASNNISVIPSTLFTSPSASINSSSTPIPFAANGGIQMFSGSSTTGMIVGMGITTVSGTFALVPIAQVFTIL